MRMWRAAAKWKCTFCLVSDGYCLRQHSKVLGFVYLRECSYAGGCLLWTCALRVSAHPGNWVNTCQGLDSVHCTVDNSRAYGATMFVYCCAVITVGLCLFPTSIFKLVVQTVMILWFKCKAKKLKSSKVQYFSNFTRNMSLQQPVKIIIWWWSRLDAVECGHKNIYSPQTHAESQLLYSQLKTKKLSLTQ